jgi:hypothetical protein
MEAGVKDRAYLDRVEATIRRLLPEACRIVAAPERRFAIEPADTPENLRISPYDVRAFSLTSLTKRLRVAGLSESVCRDITKAGLGYYDAAWAEYEDLHGTEHPRRFYDQMAASGS